MKKISASNSQPAKVGGAASVNTHGPIESGLPATTPDHGSPLHSANPGGSTPAPTGGKRKHPAEGKPVSPQGFGA